MGCGYETASQGVGGYSSICTVRRLRLGIPPYMYTIIYLLICVDKETGYPAAKMFIWHDSAVAVLLGYKSISYEEVVINMFVRIGIAVQSSSVSV